MSLFLYQEQAEPKSKRIIDWRTKLVKLSCVHTFTFVSQGPAAAYKMLVTKCFAIFSKYQNNWRCLFLDSYTAYQARIFLQKLICNCLEISLCSLHCKVRVQQYSTYTDLSRNTAAELGHCSLVLTDAESKKLLMNQVITELTTIINCSSSKKTQTRVYKFDTSQKDISCTKKTMRNKVTLLEARTVSCVKVMLSPAVPFSTYNVCTYCKLQIRFFHFSNQQQKQVHAFCIQVTRQFQ